MRMLQVDDYPIALQSILLQDSTVTYVARLEELEELARGQVYYCHATEPRRGCYGMIFRVRGDELYFADEGDPVWDNVANLMSHFAHHKVEKATLSLPDLEEGLPGGRIDVYGQ